MGLIFVFYIFTSLLYVAPIIYNPQIFLSRHNDLDQFFMPMIIYAKQNILGGTLPLWNEMYFAGMPFAADPQSGIFYLPNALFLLFPISAAFIFLILLHLIFAQYFTYLLLREIKINKTAAIFSAVLYATTGQMAGYLEAGHYGLIATWTWIPLVYLFVLKLSKKTKITYCIGFAASLSMILFTHTSSFLIVSLSTFPFFVYLVYLNPKNIVRKLILYTLSALLTFSYTAIALIPQLLWQKDTTRYVLLNNPELYPKWISKLEPLQAALIPWNYNIPTDKWIAVGILMPAIAGLAFIKVKRIYKIALTLFGIIFYLVLLGEASPFYKYISHIDMLILIRVTTRAWYLVVLILVILFAYFVNNLNKRLQILIAVLAIVEIFLLGYFYYQKPQPAMQKAYVSSEVYEFLENNLNGHRVYCVNRCLEVKETAKRNIETIDGYNTIQQTNFYKASWQLTGGFWDYYTLSIPPSGLYLHNKLTPDVNALAAYDTKYVISPYELDLEDLEMTNQFEDYLIYQIKLPTNRFIDSENNLLNYQKLSVNKYKVDTQNINSNIIFATVYNKGWRAYDENNNQIQINETPNALMAINVRNFDKVTFYYSPQGFKVGFIFSFLAFSASAIYLGLGVKYKK